MDVFNIQILSLDKSSKLKINTETSDLKYIIN